METRIRPDLKKPFRGLTTIQLFDKDTGKLVLEQHDENTYNDRLQFINYLDTVLKCKSVNIVDNTAPFSKMASESSAAGFIDSYPSVSLDGGVTTSIHNLFATLWLTNKTSAESAHGYPNGAQIGFCDACGNPSGLAAHSCCGSLNISESYLGNDRLHLVFDFATDKCNTQFDAIWLYPSMARYGSDIGNAGKTYKQVPFNGTVQLSSENVSVMPATTGSIVKAYDINWPYRVAFAGPQEERFQECFVVNRSTGDITATCKWDMYQAAINPYYYDAGSNTLYGLRIRCTDDTNRVLSYLLSDKKSSDYASYSINLTDGTITEEHSLYETFDNTTWEDLNAVTSESGLAEPAYLYPGNDLVVAWKVRIKDVSTRAIQEHFILYSFDVLTNTFSRVKDIPIYVPSVDFYASTRMMLRGSMLTIGASVDKNNTSKNSWTLLNVHTGKILATDLCSLNFSLITNSAAYRFNGSTDTASTYPDLAYISIVVDHDVYKSVYYSTRGSDILKYCYLSAMWSTHNKLTSPIKKTNMTTMKIQYDIIWDSISDVILPALM